MKCNRLMLFSVLILTLVAVLSSCERDSLRCRSCVAKLFAGFSLVGTYTGMPKGDEAISTLALSFPDSFKPGYIYVFQANTPIDAEELAITTLPERLRHCGASSIQAPRSPNDLAPVGLGNPLWEIRFKLEHCAGRITNRMNPRLRGTRRGWPSGSFDNYVLEISLSR